MPSRTLALRLPDDVYTALDNHCLITGLSKSELVLSFIIQGLKLPATQDVPNDIQARFEAIEHRLNTLEVIDVPNLLSNNLQTEGEISQIPNTYETQADSHDEGHLPDVSNIRKQPPIPMDIRLAELVKEGHRAQAIATTLNTEGYQNSKGNPITRAAVNGFIRKNPAVAVTYTAMADGTTSQTES